MKAALPLISFTCIHPPEWKLVCKTEASLVASSPPIGVEWHWCCSSWEYHALISTASKITLVLGQSCLLYIARHWNQAANTDGRGPKLVKIVRSEWGTDSQ